MLAVPQRKQATFDAVTRKPMFATMVCDEGDETFCDALTSCKSMFGSSRETTEGGAASPELSRRFLVMSFVFRKRSSILKIGRSRVL